MDPYLYTAAHVGSVQTLKSIIEKDLNILQSVAPNGNTALHFAARLGHKESAEEILRQCNTLLTMMTNKMGDTPLHEAVRHRNSEIALKLLEADPVVGHMPNLRKETPLHIAAREGLVGVVEEILKYPWVEGLEEQQQPLWGTGSLLHQAVLVGHISVVEILLNKRRDLIQVVDSSGNNALHYAAQKNSGKIVELLLWAEHSLVYDVNEEGRYPLHVAAAYDSVIAIKELLKQCPDTAEQLDYTGKNALHIAAANGATGSLEFLLQNIQPKEIVNQVDRSGNTPLHLAAEGVRIATSLLLLKDKRVDPCMENNDGRTARNIIESNSKFGSNEWSLWKALKKSEAQKCKQYAMYISPSWSASEERFKSSAGTYTLVAALIATVAFAAIFTMPGGYNQETGMAILAKHVAFKAFVISNTIAMCSSLVVVFCFIWSWKDPVLFQIDQLKWGHGLTVVACLAMLVTLTTAVYLVVADECLWLAIVVCLICCSAPFIVWVILGHEVLFIPL